MFPLEKVVSVPHRQFLTSCSRRSVKKSVLSVEEKVPSFMSQFGSGRALSDAAYVWTVKRGLAAACESSLWNKQRRLPELPQCQGRSTNWRRSWVLFWFVRRASLLHLARKLQIKTKTMIRIFGWIWAVHWRQRGAECSFVFGTPRGFISAPAVVHDAKVCNGGRDETPWVLMACSSEGFIATGWAEPMRSSLTG